ncbi:MAG: EAL domain-containing protein [Solirubrobacteraceae bacterium]
MLTGATHPDDHGDEVPYRARVTHNPDTLGVFDGGAVARGSPPPPHRPHDMSNRIEQDVHNVERGAEALLREHPNALVCGLASDGQIVPVPQSVGLWGQGAIEGRAVTDVVVAEDHMTVVKAWRRVMRDGTAEDKVRLLSKPSHWVTIYFLDLRAIHGVLLCFVLPGEEAPSEASDGAVDGIEPAPPRFCTIMQDEGGVVLDIDDAYSQMFGYGAEDVIGKPVLEQIHPDDQAVTVERWIAMLSTRRPQQLRARRKRKDGRYVWLDLTLHNHLNQPDHKCVLVEMIDVSAEMAAQDALQEKSELLRRLIEGTPDGLLQLDDERGVVYYNARLLEILHGGVNLGSTGATGPAARGDGDKELPAISLGDLLGSLSEKDRACFETALDRVLDEGVDRDVEIDVALRTGGWRRAQMNLRVLRHAGGEVSGAIISVLDVTDSVRARRELEGVARLDRLTRCQDRSSILAAVQRELDRADSTSTGVVYVKLDDFKLGDDEHGRAAGDELLVLVAERLRAASRNADEIGRLGGGEFLVLLPEIASPEVATSVARRVGTSLRTEAVLSSASVAVGASVGVSCTSGESISARELVERAGEAVSRSKELQRAEHAATSRGRGARRKQADAPRSTPRRRAGKAKRDSLSQTDAQARAALTPAEVERRLTQHTRQHDAVAHLGGLALRGHGQGALLEEVVETVARTLELDLCTVLKLRENEEVLDIIASVGYNHGPSALPAGTATQSGYALSTRAPVVTGDLHNETRFDSKLLLEQGMLSGMSAVIEGRDRPFGVLTAHTSRRAEFRTDDVNFLLAIANVVSATVERERKEDSARYAALHDHLTGFPNRTLALDRIDRALARRRRDGTAVAVLLLDIDRFKIINDSLGHEPGDAVLVALAARLEDALRGSDTIARLGGDEFLIVSEHLDGARYAVELAKRLGDAVRRPLALESGEHHLSASIGIAVAAQSEDTSASLLRDADAAMHRAKGEGRGRSELFDETVRAEVVTRLRTETELRQALELDQLEIHYQPIVDTASGAPVAAEALVRWRHPHHGLVPPLDFIPIAEEAGLIGALGRYVLERASAQGAAWQQRYGAPLKIYVNVSGFQLADVEFAAQAVEIARRSGLMPETLGLEVTESVLIAEGTSSIDVLNELDAHGLPLVLDDFGTGYSSLSYLRRFPLSSVKVDRSFIDGLGSNPQDAAIMKAIVDMCRALDLTVVGEGVETEAQLSQLRTLGCDHVQGYLICHPMPLEQASEFLDERFGHETLDRAA